MPNPSGANQFAPQPAYGDVQKLTALTRSAPMSGAPVSAVEAPRRAQRRAVRGAQPQAQPAAPPAGAPPQEAPQLPASTVVANVFQQLAADPGANDLVKQLALEAQQ